MVKKVMVANSSTNYAPSPLACCYFLKWQRWGREAGEAFVCNPPAAVTPDFLPVKEKGTENNF